MDLILPRQLSFLHALRADRKKNYWIGKANNRANQRNENSKERVVINEDLDC